MNSWLGSVTDDAIESCVDGRNSCEKPVVRSPVALAAKEHVAKVAVATAVWETKLLERARTQVVVVVPAVAARERVVMVRGEVPHGHRERSRMG